MKAFRHFVFLYAQKKVTGVVCFGAGDIGRGSKWRKKKLLGKWKFWPLAWSAEAAAGDGLVIGAGGKLRRQVLKAGNL